MALPKIDIDLIFSDPLLSVGALLVVMGVLLFFFSAYKFLRFKNAHKDDFVVPHQDKPELNPSVAEIPAVSIPDLHDSAVLSAPIPESVEPVNAPQEPMPSKPLEPNVPKPVEREFADKTMVMPAGVSDIQAQLEIALSQVKQLNKRVMEMENIVERLQDRHLVKLEPNELKEPPMNPGDFTQKLLKVVEHILILEKEVSRLRSKQAPHAPETKSSVAPKEGSPESPGKPPIMPL